MRLRTARGHPHDVSVDQPPRGAVLVELLTRVGRAMEQIEQTLPAFGAPAPSHQLPPEDLARLVDRLDAGGEPAVLDALGRWASARDAFLDSAAALERLRDDGSAYSGTEPFGEVLAARVRTLAACRSDVEEAAERLRAAVASAIDRPG